MFDKKTKQLGNVAVITFWGQFASYTFNAILIIFLTMPLVKSGLGLSEHDAYLLYGVIQAMGYILPVAGGYLADEVLGLRRSILFGSFLLAISFLLLVTATHLAKGHVHTAFLLTYPLIPITNSLLMGTASAMIGRIYMHDDQKAKRGMTVYYITINLGSMLGIAIAPMLINSSYGPLGVFLLAFMGKFLAWLNFSLRRKLYDDVLFGKDTERMTSRKWSTLLAYIAVAYAVVVFLFDHPQMSVFIIAAGILFAIALFASKTMKLTGVIRQKQLLSLYLLVIGFVFFVLYNQMNTSMILFTKNNSDLTLLGFKLYPSSFQLVNPIAIVVIGSFITKLYQRFPRFNIPYQFATGIIIGGIGISILYLAGLHAQNGLVSGNYVATAYLVLTVAELFVSAIGLSMISLYCDMKMMAFAMGVWFLTTSLSNLASGELSELVALPKHHASAVHTLPIYTHYYFYLGLASVVIGLVFMVISRWFNQRYQQRGIVLP